MSDERDEHPQPHPHPQHPLPVLPNSGKVEQLRADAEADAKAQATPAAASAPKHVDTTIVTRFVDAKKTPQQKAIEEKVVAAIQSVYDPEIPVNIYDLGLIYAIDVDDATGKVHVKMTLTAPACPVAGTLPVEVERRIEAIDEVPSAVVELVWDPPWSREMMSEAAQLELGLM
jgi:FeS assembly SUF system protein